MLLTVTD